MKGSDHKEVLIKATEKPRELVIPKEKAIFWLDKHGFWHTDHGRFENHKIIRHFHSSIRRDNQGYYIGQEHPDFTEKVYFPYEDTALFVFQVLNNDNEIILVLNTGDSINLNPEDLYIRHDYLYMRRGEEKIKFTETALIRISDNIEEDKNGQFVIELKGKKYQIPVEPNN